MMHYYTQNKNILYITLEIVCILGDFFGGASSANRPHMCI